MIRSIIRKYTQQTKASQASQTFKVAQPPKYTLASLRSFPSLEPHTFIPLPSNFFDAPLRRDMLWSAVVFEADRARVGSNYVLTKGDKLFSNRKLHPQKRTGRARVGDANSPIRYNPIKAHGIKAPHDWSTLLPVKVYNKAVLCAFSDQYRNGRVFIIGGDESSLKNRHDSCTLDFRYNLSYATELFINSHDLELLNLLFIVDTEKPNLVQSTQAFGKKVSVIAKENLEVRDILKANRIYIEAPALKWIISKYGSF